MALSSSNLHSENRDASAALAFFRETVGEEASHLVYAPGRVNLIGEHTDYNGGFVLPMAIELGIYIAAKPRNDQRIRVWSAEMPEQPAEFIADASVKPGEPSWSNYVRGVVGGLCTAGMPLPGFDACIYANLPPGGGLSSSAALEVSTATLGESLSGMKLDPLKKALLCQRAEHVYAGTPCGIMDQFAVTFAQEGNLLLIDCQSMAREQVPMAGTDTTILIINTMVRHELTDGGYASRRDDCHEAARLLGVKELRDVTPERVDEARDLLSERIFRRARHVTTEDRRTLAAAGALRRGDWSAIGELMYGSHDSLRDDFNVSCEELDAVVAAAKALGITRGVYGCRMTGGGFGGSCVALVQTDKAPEIEAAIREAYVRATGITPTIFSSRPANGATVLVQP